VISEWLDGNSVRLIENGEAFFGRVFELIEQAEQEVLLETFIWFEDQVGTALHQRLLAAVRRGVNVVVTVDGFGSEPLTEPFIAALTEAGVRFQIYDPRPRLLGMRTNLFRRLHRKITLVDGHTAFVGGINYSDEHIDDGGPITKQDYAVELRGPIVDRIHQFARSAFAAITQDSKPAISRLRPRNPRSGSMCAAFFTRDNEHHRNDIERQYLQAIRAARREIIIANAYFLPGYRLLHEIWAAAERGVSVTLILQGDPDMPAVKAASTRLYDYLLEGGVCIRECGERQLHGKVAVIDDSWATVGSSNLDPLSLSLNLECNVMIRDRQFTAVLRERLQALIAERCITVERSALPRRTIGRAAINFAMFHFLRHFPAWVGWMPAHTPRLQRLEPEDSAERERELEKHGLE
jgi:cardiolipin synthase